MAKVPWRFQGDIARGEIDPLVTVFMGDEVTDEGTGVVTVRQDVSDPVVMKLSELASASHLADPKKMDEVATKQRGKRIADRREAERLERAAKEKTLAAQPKTQS